MFDFTNIFRTIGTNIATELKQKMQSQSGTDGGRYNSLKPATVRAKEKVSSVTAPLRMIRTKDFLNNAFKSEAMPNGVKVFISNAQHGRALKSLRATHEKYVAKYGYESTKAAHQRVKIAEAQGITYDKLAEYQLDTESAIFFPQSHEQVMNLASVQNGAKKFEDEAVKQAEEMFKLQLTRELNIAI